MFNKYNLLTSFLSNPSFSKKKLMNLLKNHQFYQIILVINFWLIQNLTF